MATKQPTVGVNHPTVVPENYDGGAEDADADVAAADDDAAPDATGTDKE